MIVFDELTHFSETNYRYLFSRMRRLKGTKIPLKIRGASNPPDEGQGVWVYDRFVNPKTKLKDVIFLPAGLDDNPFVDAESYDEMLNELDPVTRARLRDGIWTKLLVRLIAI
ncbi:MAG: phage terminase large subunit [Paraclostridium sp.]